MVNCNVIESRNVASTTALISGANENAGLENAGPSKMQGWNMQDWKMRHQIAGVENAEPRKYGKPTNTPVVNCCSRQ